MPLQLGTIDIGGDGKEVLLDSLNFKLSTNFKLEDFDFGLPAAVTTPNPTHNTVITFGPKAHSGYYGIRKIYYNRVHISELGNISVVKGSATRVSHLLQKINQKYGILITELDIYDAVLPDIPQGQTEIEVLLDFRPTSIVFYGGTKINMGLNDPALTDYGTDNAPFEAAWMFYAESIKNQTLDAYSVSLDATTSRKRVASTIVGSAVQDIGLMFQRDIAPGEGEGYFGHLVGCWKGADNNVVRGINIYGHILDRTYTALSWSKIGDTGGINMTDAAAVNDAQLKKPVKFVIQGSGGDIFFLQDAAGVMTVYKSTDFGDSWSPLTLTSSHEVLNASAWNTKYIRILDKIMVDETIYLLVNNNESGNVKLDVVAIDTDALTVTAHSISGKTILNTPVLLSIELDDFVLGSFVSADNLTGVTPSVALLTAAGISTTPEVFLCDFDGTNYQVKATGTCVLYPEQATYPGAYISAYSTMLEKDNTISLDVIEVGTMIEAQEPDFEVYVQTSKLRTEKQFYGHGVLAMTSVRRGAQRNKWITTAVPLAKGTYPQRIIFFDYAKRTHYVIQPEYGIQKLTFNEDNTVTGFIPAYDVNKVLNLEGHSGFDYHSSEGLNKYSSPILVETTNVTYGMTNFSNAEASAANIQYSFLGRDETGKPVWLTSPAPATPLSRREFSPEYRFMGKLPVAVFNVDTQLYVVARDNKGVYSYDAANKRWQFYAESKAEIKGSPSKYIGWSSFQLESRDFVGLTGSTTFTNFGLRVKVNRNVNLTVSGSADLNTPTSLVKEGIIGIDPARKNIEELDKMISSGFNLLDTHSPKRFDLFVQSSDGTFKTNYHYTDAADYDTSVEDVTLPANFPANFTVLDVKPEVAYLDIKCIYYGHDDNDVYKLLFLDNSDTFTTKELLGGTDPDTSNFKPEAAFHLYDFNETNWVPLIYYGNRKILLMNRLDEYGNFAKTVHNLSVPSDNSNPLTLIPVLSSNRQEYLLYQKSNGIFRINYSYDAATRVSTFNLIRLFTLSIGFEGYIFDTACVSTKNNVVHPTVPFIPTFPANGTLLNTFCTGKNKMGRYADGVGGVYIDTIEVNSVDCGYVAPPPGTLSADAVTITASLTQVDNALIVPTVVAKEDGTEAFIKYTLSDALIDDLHLDCSLTFDTASAADIDKMELIIGSGTPTPMTYPSTITIPAGQTEFKLAFKYVADAATEGEEKFSVTVKKQASSMNVRNADPIVTEMTIIDSSR